MKSNSDDSEYEDQNFDNQYNGVKLDAKQTFQKTNDATTSFTDDKQTSDSNDSDYGVDYFKNFNQQGNDIKFKSHDMYQNISCEQNSDDEYSSHDIRFEKSGIKNYNASSTYTVEKDDPEKSRTMYQNSSDDESKGEFEKQRLFTKDKDSTSSNNDILDCEIEKFGKRKHHNLSNNGTDKFSKHAKLDQTKDNTDIGKDIDDVVHQSSARKSTSAFAADDKAQRMMKLMGYKAGHGLGKNKQGRLEPVEAHKQHGRRGFGHHVPELQAASLKWNVAEEEIKVREDLKWLVNTSDQSLNLEEMKDWIKLGPKKETIHDETNFCDPEIVRNILNSKTVFDNLDKVEMRNAIARSNPYETIRKAFFLNRAAVKMANIDKACDFIFTNPEKLQSNELLYFADVCAGPGGFSEYVLWRKKWHAKGFGFTLKNENDFKLADFYAGPCETFHPFYGPKENGDVFDPSNQEAFRNLIMKHTNGKGVHFMMSDGGFSVEGQENIQEILSKQLYLCQCLVALMIVRTGGHFVTKLFDLFTPFSAGLVYIMYRCFDEISIFKPNSSRPANSERYLICKRKRSETEDALQLLLRANHLILKKDKLKDVMELVPLEKLESEEQFLQYLKESNEYLGRKQITGLLKVAAFCEDNNLIERKQADMRKQCLMYWEIPDESRTVPWYGGRPQDRLNMLLKNPTRFLLSNPTKLTKDNIDRTILDQPLGWFCMPCGTGPSTEESKMATFYLGMGKRRVYRYINGNWIQISDIKIELPPDTLVYAEVVYELTKEYRHQQKIPALHILDAYMLGAEDISHKYLQERHELTKKFCNALWKPSDNDCARIRAKELYLLMPNIDEKLKVRQRIMKNNRVALTYEFSKMPLDYDRNDQDIPYYIPNSIVFLRSTAQPWTRHISKTHCVTYVFNSKTRDTKFDVDRSSTAEASFAESFENRVVWYWPNDDELTMETLVQLLKDKCPELLDKNISNKIENYLTTKDTQVEITCTKTRLH